MKFPICNLHAGYCSDTGIIWYIYLDLWNATVSLFIEINLTWNPTKVPNLHADCFSSAIILHFNLEIHMKYNYTFF